MLKEQIDVLVHPNVSTPLEVITVSVIQAGRKFRSLRVKISTSVVSELMDVIPTLLVLIQQEAGNAHVIAGITQIHQMRACLYAKTSMNASRMQMHAQQSHYVSITQVHTDVTACPDGETKVLINALILTSVLKDRTAVH